MLALGPLFFLAACVYAMIGFAGGSTYTALLALADTDYRVIPIVSLACNIAVAAGGVWRFAKEGFLDIRRLLPWLALSVPCAFAGGRIVMDMGFFLAILGAALSMVGVAMLTAFREKPPPAPPLSSSGGWRLALTGGGALGLLAGVTGIGGGVYLAPVLHSLRWAPPRQIAAACSLFILINSLAGMAGQIVKGYGTGLFPLVWAYCPLLPLVIGGGMLGSWLGATRLPGEWIKKGTGLLVLYAGIQLLRKVSAL